MSDIFKALGNRKRREILKLVLNKEMHISAIAREIGISVPVALKHVNMLEDAGLITRQKVGRSHIINANVEEIKRLGDIWGLEESFAFKIKKGSTVQEALDKVPGISIKGSGTDSYIDAVDGRKGYYLIEVDGRIMEEPINKHVIEEECEIELKRLVPVLGKKIKITLN